MRKLTAGKRKEFERIIESTRVAGVVIDHVKNFLQIVTEPFRPHLAFTSPHPADVAAKRIDLAVVSYITKRLGSIPVRKSIRAETRMNKSERGLKIRCMQIRIKRSDLFGRKHALVDDGSRRKTCKIELLGELRVRTCEKL